MTKLNIVVVDDDESALRNIAVALRNTEWSVHLIDPTAKGWRTTLDEVCDQIRKAAGDNAVILLDHEFIPVGWNGEHVAKRFADARIISISSVSRPYAKHSLGCKDVLDRIPELQESWIEKIKEVATI